MKTIRKHKKGAFSLRGVILRALVVWAVILAVGTLITAYLITKGILPLDNAGYGVVLIHLLASFAASTVASSKAMDRKILYTAGCAGGIILIIVLANFLFMGDGMPSFWVTALVIVGGSISSFFLNSKQKRRGRFRGIKY